MKVMTVEQIRDYTALALRYSNLIDMSGSRWRPEYAAEMAALKNKIESIRKEFADFFADGR